MNILITGVSGFIGQHLSDSLKNRHELFGVTRSLTSGHNLDRDNVIFADLSSTNFTEKLPKGIDCVIHLAQSHYYRDFPEGVADMRQVNIDSTCMLLEWARVTGVKQFIFTSTANVYGNSKEVLKESDPTTPTSFYGASKLAAEHLVNQYKDFFQVDILRLFTVYGPGQKNMLIPNIINRIKTNKVITLADGVGVYLTPVYVNDVVCIINKLLEFDAGPSIRLLNICGGDTVHLGEIVSIIEKAIGLEASIMVTGDDAQHFIGDNTMVTDYFDSFPYTNIEQGLVKTVENMNMVGSDREDYDSKL